jgi:hypothetical protein
VRNIYYTHINLSTMDTRRADELDKTRTPSRRNDCVTTGYEAVKAIIAVHTRTVHWQQVSLLTSGVLIRLGARHLDPAFGIHVVVVRTKRVCVCDPCAWVSAARCCESGTARCRDRDGMVRETWITARMNSHETLITAKMYSTLVIYFRIGVQMCVP